MNNDKMFEEITGRSAPRSFLALDASVMEDLMVSEAEKAEIQFDRIKFVFPQGLVKVPLMEECRVLESIDDFDAMYDFTMTSLEGKSVRIEMKMNDGNYGLLAEFQVTDKYMNLRGIDVIDENPILVNWLVKFMGAYISKKYPLPGNAVKPQPDSKKKAAKKTR